MKGWQLGEGLFKLGNIKLDHKELGKSILFTIYVIPPPILWHRLWNLNRVDFFSTMQPNTLNPGQDIFYHDRRQGGGAKKPPPLNQLKNCVKFRTTVLKSFSVLKTFSHSDFLLPSKEFFGSRILINEIL